MHWTDQGIIIGLRKQGENGAIVELLTAQHGRHAGLVRGVFGKSGRAIYMPGNRVEAQWSARLPEHLGHWKCELVDAFAAHIMHDRLRLQALNAMTSLLKYALAEREPHAQLFAACKHTTAQLANEHTSPAHILATMAWLELLLLQELGFGLDMTECAATGSRQDLLYISPKSGRAVCREAGEPYKDRLLPLPAYLKNITQMDEFSAINAENMPVTATECIDAARLTGYFLQKWLFAALERPVPEARSQFIAACQRMLHPAKPIAEPA